MRSRSTGRRLLAAACVIGLGAGVAGTASASSSSTPGTTAGTAATGSAAAGPGDFGDLKGVCGPGDAKGSTEQGVTDTEIVVGTSSDPGNTVAPGLNQEIFDAADAFVGWCNDAGGIAGRKIKLNKRDAKLFEAGPRMVEACQTDFMQVGIGMALDNTAVEPRKACGMPQIAAYTVSQEAGRSDGSIESITNSDTTSHLGPILRHLAAKDATAKDSLALWNNNFASVTPTGNRTKKAAELAGYQVKVYEELPTAVDNWRPYVEKLKEQNVQVLIDYHSAETLVAAMKTMNDVGYFPKYMVLEGNFYNDKMIKEAGDLIGKSTILVNAMMWPFEDAKDNPATQQFIDILKKYVPDATPKSLGVNAFSAWLLFAQSARDCGSDLTRKCVMEKAGAAKDWTGGGLHVKVLPGPTTSRNSDCFSILQATAQGFAVATDYVQPNDKIYNCDPSNSEPLPS